MLHVELELKLTNNKMRLSRLHKTMPVRRESTGSRARGNGRISGRMLKLDCFVYLVHLVCLV